MPEPVLGGRAVHELFAGIARLRQNRAFHPHGVVFEAEVAFEPGPSPTPALFQRTEKLRALVRLSRATGLPEPLPDVLGCAVRVLDAYGDGRHQDLILASSGRLPLGRHSLLPGRDFCRAFYSSLLPYRTRMGVTLFGARVEGLSEAVAINSAAGAMATARVNLFIAGLLGAWQPVANVALGSVAEPGLARDLRFNPFNTGVDIKPMGPLMRLRDHAYRGSQEVASD